MKGYTYFIKILKNLNIIKYITYKIIQKFNIEEISIDVHVLTITTCSIKQYSNIINYI